MLKTVSTDPRTPDIGITSDKTSENLQNELSEAEAGGGLLGQVFDENVDCPAPKHRAASSRESHCESGLHVPLQPKTHFQR